MRTPEKPARASRRRLPPVSPGDKITYKSPDLLRKFITERGRIISRRVNRLSAKQQRLMALEIKRARLLGLLPFLSHGNG